MREIGDGRSVACHFAEVLPTDAEARAHGELGRVAARRLALYDARRTQPRHGTVERQPATLE